MGQYHKVYNTTKGEMIHPHEIGASLKLMEQCGPNDDCTTSDALFLLLANSNGRGGWDASTHPYIGRWAGDAIVVQGDYANPTDPGYVPEGVRTAYVDISPEVRDMLGKVFNVDLSNWG
jgi:hypothetical protein